MCGACGIIGGGPDWIDRGESPRGLTRLAERQRRLRLVNLLLRASRTKAEDAGAVVVMRGPTGQTQVIDSLAHVWVAVERLGAGAIDPLDERVLAALGTAA
jgi:hypothetical protein